MFFHHTHIATTNAQQHKHNTKFGGLFVGQLGLGGSHDASHSTVPHSVVYINALKIHPVSPPLSLSLSLSLCFFLSVCVVCVRVRSFIIDCSSCTTMVLCLCRFRSVVVIIVH